MDDYHAYTSTTNGGGHSGVGCSGGFLTWVLIGLTVLYILGKIFT